MSEGPPNPIALDRAANAPVGDRQNSDVATEIAVCVALPLLVPAILEVVFRIRAVPRGMDVFGLADIAFGFAAAAIAGMVRSVTLRGEQWRAFVWVAFSVLLIQVAIGLAADTVPAWQRLTADVRTTLSSTDHQSSSGSTSVLTPSARSELNRDADDATVGRGGVLWLIALPVGLFLLVAEVIFILRVR